MPPIKTFYDELGIGRDAGAAEIKRAFKEIAKIYHPDKNPPEKQAWAHEQMSRVNFIVATLLDAGTRAEYDELVRKYETEPDLVRQSRGPREQYAIEREYAQVSVQIINLDGRSSNCRLKMLIGASVGSVAASVNLLGLLTPLLEPYPVAFVFSYFFSMSGGALIVLGLRDYFGRNQYRQQIRELEERRAFLRQRMYEPSAW